MNLVLTGGGTGGHIFAGVAIAQNFKSRDPKNNVLFIGSEYGLEVRLVPKAGFELKTVKLGKLVGQGALTRLLTLVQIPIAVIKSMLWLKQFRADMVIGVGGYAAGPCIIAAKILGIRIGVLEQNAIMGFTNRLSAKLADHVFTAFDTQPAGIPATKWTFSGNPSRSELHPKATNTSGTFTVFTFGGSQGASGINRMLVEAAREFRKSGINIRIIHQTGVREYEQVKKNYAQADYPAEVYQFIDNMQAMYDQADLVVCRAGSGTIAELGTTRSAAILIPFPAAAGNHQVHNALSVEKAGGGKMLLQIKDGVDTSGAELAKLILELKESPVQLERMRKNISLFHKADAAQRIIDIMSVHGN